MIGIISLNNVEALNKTGIDYLLFLIKLNNRIININVKNKSIMEF